MALLLKHGAQVLKHVAQKYNMGMDANVAAFKYICDRDGCRRCCKVSQHTWSKSDRQCTRMNGVCGRVKIKRRKRRRVRVGNRRKRRREREGEGTIY